MSMIQPKQLAGASGNTKACMQGRLTLRACTGDSHSEHARETHTQSSEHARGSFHSKHARETHTQSMQGRLTLRASLLGLPAQSKSKLLCILPSILLLGRRPSKLLGKRPSMLLLCRRPSMLCILLSTLFRIRLSKLCRRPPAAKLPLLPVLRNSLSCTHTHRHTQLNG